MKALVTEPPVSSKPRRHVRCRCWWCVRCGQVRTVGICSPGSGHGRGDLGDPDSLERALEDCEGLFHVARTICWAHAIQTLYRTNVEGTRTILEALPARSGTANVYTSSVGGPSIPADGSPGEERTPVARNMIGHYKRSKQPRQAMRGKRPGWGCRWSSSIHRRRWSGRHQARTPTGQLVWMWQLAACPPAADTDQDVRRRRRRTSAGIRARQSGEFLHPGGEDDLVGDSPRSRGSSDADRRVSVRPAAGAAGGLSGGRCTLRPQRWPGDARRRVCRASECTLPATRRPNSAIAGGRHRGVRWWMRCPGFREQWPAGRRLYIHP